ncbi:hypothetical protein [Parabacteroides goldsteinii]|jgi:hypothetical protein|uniref:hypothetical protein n=1 Tax=Parabacteroides goldsteinii TaxID=328812 RepID=UPI0032B2CA28
MQNKINNALREQTSNNHIEGLASQFERSLKDKPVQETIKVQLNPAISIPAPLKKKRFSNDLIKSLNETHERPVQFSDPAGDYKEGVFLHGSNIVIVDRIDGRWQLTIQGERPLTMYEIKAARYKFVPNDVYMVLVLPSRAKLEKFTSPDRMQLIEIAVTKSEENE